MFHQVEENVGNLLLRIRIKDDFISFDFVRVLEQLNRIRNSNYLRPEGCMLFGHY
jgi:hypothetical protein